MVTYHPQYKEFRPWHIFDILPSLTHRPWDVLFSHLQLQVSKGHGSKKRPRLDCHSTIPIAKHRRDGRPLERDIFCWRVGHDFQPEKMEEWIMHKIPVGGWCKCLWSKTIYVFKKGRKQGLGMEHLGNLIVNGKVCHWVVKWFGGCMVLLYFDPMSIACWTSPL